MVSSFILGSEKEDMCSSHRLVKAMNLDFSPKWIKGMALLFYHTIPRTNIHTGNREFNDTTSEVWPYSSTIPFPEQIYILEIENSMTPVKYGPKGQSECRRCIAELECTVGDIRHVLRCLSPPDPSWLYQK
uniref:Uncharacterized protein n=1 Tax=Salix viminalis TaxID=40686 RepID=A0A6N2KCE6_SALVM